MDDSNIDITLIVIYTTAKIIRYYGAEMLLGDRTIPILDPHDDLRFS